MGASVNIRTYSDYWMRLFEIFNERPREEYIVHCKSEKEARKVRLEWYKARAALQREEQKMDAATFAEFGHPNLVRKECLIKPTGICEFNVCFSYKEDSDVAKLLKASLEEKAG